MKILLDENMPTRLRVTLALEGHEVDSVRSLQLRPVARLKLVHVIIPQTRQDEFIEQFLVAFRATDWTGHTSGDDWPTA